MDIRKQDHEQHLLYHPEKKDILQQIEELAYYYTPEWRFHSEHPDAGSVLAELYADMYMRLLHQYHLVPERDKQFFFQWLGIHRNPAEPARGYVSFGVQKEAGAGIVIPAGTGLIGKDKQGKSIRLQTCMELYASASRIKSVYLCDGKEDRIQCLAEEEGKLPDTGCPDLQEHVCQFGHSALIPVSGEMELLMALDIVRSRTDWNEILSDPELIGFSYSSVQGEWEFREWECRDHVIHIKKTGDMPDFLPQDIQGRNCFCIKWYAKDIRICAGLELTGMLLGSVGGKQPPESVYTADGEEGVSCYYPFGERPYPYGEFYLCSNAVLGRKRAAIRLRLKLEFRKVPLLTEPVPLPIHWKTIMRQSDFPEEKETAVTIGEVVWEYYNGTEFTRIFNEALYTDCFTPEGEEMSEKQICMEFNCPADIQPFLVHAGTTYCIRARILRIRNAFPRNGYYLSPYITQAELDYDYYDSMQEPETCICWNHLQERTLYRHQSFVPFQKLADERQAVYIGFDQGLQGGPFGLFCAVSPWSFGTGTRWSYEYFNGTVWKDMTVEDETGNLQKSGSLLLFVNEIMEPGSFFGKNQYWIRLAAVEDAREGRREDALPIREIWWNTVPIIAVSGSCGNLEAGQVCQMERSIRFINRITNHHSLAGGRQEESREEAVTRLSRKLCHHDRAVMLSDYEALAREASREVARVKAFSGRGMDAGRKSGAVTLVVQPEAYDREGFDFQGLQKQIYEYLFNRVPGIRQLQDCLSIILPWFTEIRVSAVCVLEPHASAHICRAEAEGRLMHFLNPLTGNFDGGGWGIGEVPGIEQIRNALRDTDGIGMIKKLVVKAYRQAGKQLQEIDLAGNIPAYVMITSGRHRIQLERY